VFAFTGSPKEEEEGQRQKGAGQDFHSDLGELQEGRRSGRYMVEGLQRELHMSFMSHININAHKLLLCPCSLHRSQSPTASQKSDVMCNNVHVIQYYH